MTVQQKEVTIEMVLKEVPEMRGILERAKKARSVAEADDADLWSIWKDYTILKREAAQFIGFNRYPTTPDVDWMGSTGAYEVMIRALSEALGV